MAYSVKEAANFRALHYEAGKAVLDDVVSKLRSDLQTPGISPGDAHKIQQQIEGIQAYQAELQTQADNYRSDRFQDNADRTADKKQLKRMMGGTRSALS